MFLKNRNIIFKMKISKVTDYAALDVFYWNQVFALDSAAADKRQKMFREYAWEFFLFKVSNPCINSLELPS